MIAPRRVFQHARLDLDARRAQRRDPGTGCARIGVARRHDHTRNARLNQRATAGGRLSGVIAGFQRHIGRGPAAAVPA
jgi:hypothetical protein